jgi:hypothetical protein
LLESDLAWAPTHTLTNPFTEVVDHSAAASILAAGKVGRSSTTATRPALRRSRLATILAIEEWQRLWSLLTTPPSDLDALRQVLDGAAYEGPEALQDSVGRLPESVRWVAEENLGKGSPVVAVLIELVDLVLATGDRNGTDIGEAILQYEWLTRSNEPAGNSRCYCGSGKKYKHCHGSDGNEQRRAQAIRHLP